MTSRRAKGLKEAAALFDSGEESRVSERLRKAADRRGGISAMARLAGIPYRSAVDYISGAKIPLERAATISNALGVSLRWLATGEGEMDEATRELEKMKSDGFILVPRFSVEAAAGAGAVVEQEQIVDFLAFKADWIRSLGRNPATLLVLQATGDSMETAIAHGDVLLVDRTEPRIRDNAIYVLVFGDALVVKRLHRRRDGSVVIRSDNPRYPEEVVPKEEVDSLRVIGDVFWTGGRV